MQMVPNYIVSTPFPRTLGACRSYCAEVAGESNPAVKLLDAEIQAHGSDGAVAPQVRDALYPLLISDEPL